MSDAEDRLEATLKRAGVREFVRELVFAKPRRWRFDFAWPDLLVAVEVEGGIWIRGAHSRGRGYEANCEKYNEAALRGWKVLRVTPTMVDDGRALATIERAVGTAPKPLGWDETSEDDAGPDLWGPEGPSVGQTIELTNIPGFFVRWTGTHWERA